MITPRSLSFFVWLGLCILTISAYSSAAHAKTDASASFIKITRGGEGGRVIEVTRTDDHPENPKPGSLRWAMNQSGPRVVKIKTKGDIVLQDGLEVRVPQLTLDGSEAPGVDIRGGSLGFVKTHDIALKQVRIRLGKAPAVRQRKQQKADRPKSSGGLDCISLHDSKRILIEHCSLSESCDELIGITRCDDVLVRHCLLANPLAGPELHPYGDEHAFIINASASTLTVERCLFAHYVMRGPQFECNDLRPKDRDNVRMAAVQNIMFDYARSGSRYSLGVEKGQGTGKGKEFLFEFKQNLYVPANKGKKTKTIEAITKHKGPAKVTVRTDGNEALGVPKFATTVNAANRVGKGGFSPLPSRNPSWLQYYGTTFREGTTWQQVLRDVGAMPRDRYDARVVRELKDGTFRYSGQ